MRAKKLKVQKVLLRGRPRFKVDLGVMEGRRCIKHFELESDAEKYLQRTRKLLYRQGTAGFQISDSERNDAATALSFLKDKGIKTSLVQTVKFFVRYARPTEEERTVQDAVSELLESKKKSGKSKEYIRELAMFLRRLAEDFKDRKIGTLVIQEVEKHIDSKKLPPTSRRNYMRKLNTLFNYCVKRKYCSENPLAGIEKTVIKEKPVEILTVDQCRTLLDTASKPDYREILPSIAIGLFAGLRTIEIRRLEWTEINISRRIIEVKATKAKTRQRRIVDISDNLAAWLSLKPHSSGLVAPKGERWRKKFEPLVDEAGIRPWPANLMRHSFGSYHLVLSQDPGKTAFQMGHNNTHVLFRHYRELVQPEESKRYWALFPDEDILRAGGISQLSLPLDSKNWANNQGYDGNSSGLSRGVKDGKASVTSTESKSERYSEYSLSN